MADSQRADGMDISAFFGVLRRRVLIIGATTVAAAAAAYFISDAQEPSYSASSKLLLSGTPTGSAGALYAAPLPETAPDREALLLSAR